MEDEAENLVEFDSKESWMWSFGSQREKLMYLEFSRRCNVKGGAERGWFELLVGEEACLIIGVLDDICVGNFELGDVITV